MCEEILVCSWAPAADQSGSINLTSGTGITISGTAPNLTITNSGDTNASDDITTSSTANGDVTGAFSNLQLKADVVGTTELTNSAVETANLANKAVTGAKIDDMGASSGQILKWTGTTWAPAYVAQGPNNRTALVRTLNSRFEWRAPDASANPYLLLAGLIAAGLDGIERELDPGPDCEEDLFALTLAQIAERGIALLPQSLGEALDALEADATVCAALGDTLTREFVALKRDEQTAYARHVSDWELQRYVTAF